MEEHDQQLLNLQLSYLYNNVPVNLPKIKQVSTPIIPATAIKAEKIEAQFSSIFKNEIKVEDESSVAFPENSNLSPDSLKCRFCLKTKASKRDLVLHERIHTGLKEFKCKHCAREFTWKQPWLKHEGSCSRSSLNTHRSRGRPPARKTKSTSFSLINNKQENPGSDSMDESTRTPPPAPAVGARVAKDHRLVLTENINQVPNIGRYKCNCCPRRFASMSTAQNHQNVHKLGMESEHGNPYEENSHENQNVKADTTVKAKASRSSSKVRSRPKKIKRNLSSKKKTRSAAASTIIGHRRIRQKEQRQQKKIVANNLKLTTGSVSVSKNGSSKYRRNRNIRSKHSQINKPKPMLNSFVPVRGGRVKRITYTCSYCPRGFTQRCNFLNHERQHTGEEPFSCDRCGSKFKAASGLSYHRIKSRSSPCSSRYTGTGVGVNKSKIDSEK